MNREKLKDAYAIFAGIPAHRVIYGLQDWFGNEEANPIRSGVAHCGAVACYGGWLAMHPDFGGVHEYYEWMSLVTIQNAALVSMRAVLDLSTQENCDLFSSRGNSRFDNEPGCQVLSDKMIALYRTLRVLGYPEGAATVAKARHDARGVTTAVEGGQVTREVELEHV